MFLVMEDEDVSQERESEWRLYQLTSSEIKQINASDCRKQTNT